VAGSHLPRYDRLFHLRRQVTDQCKQSIDPAPGLPAGLHHFFHAVLEIVCQLRVGVSFFKLGEVFAVDVINESRQDRLLVADPLPDLRRNGRQSQFPAAVKTPATGGRADTLSSSS